MPGVEPRPSLEKEVTVGGGLSSLRCPSRAPRGSLESRTLGQQSWAWGGTGLVPGLVACGRLRGPGRGAVPVCVCLNTRVLGRVRGAGGDYAPDTFLEHQPRGEACFQAQDRGGREKTICLLSSERALRGVGGTVWSYEDIGCPCCPLWPSAPGAWPLREPGTEPVTQPATGGRGTGAWHRGRPARGTAGGAEQGAVMSHIPQAMGRHVGPELLGVP